MAKKFLIVLGLAALGLIALLAVAGYVGSSQAVSEAGWARGNLRTPRDYGLESRVVEFPSLDGIGLKAWWLPAQGGAARATILLAHGNMMNRGGMLPRAAFLVRSGYNVLDLDLRAHGESQGSYMTPGVYEARDLLGGIRYAREQLHFAGPIAVLGYSYGGVAAIHAAAQSPEIAAVIADSAFISMDDVTARALASSEIPPLKKMALRLSLMPYLADSLWLMYYLRTGVWIARQQADALPQIPKIGTRPILFIAGERDAIAPPESVRKMYEAARSPQKQFWIVPGASHIATYRASPQEYESRVLKFLESAGW